MGGCRSDGGARHTEVYGTQECRAHRGTYGAQKGAASIGVLGVQALLQQLLAEGWRCAGKQTVCWGRTVQGCRSLAAIRDPQSSQMPGLLAG